MSLNKIQNHDSGLEARIKINDSMDEISKRKIYEIEAGTGISIDETNPNTPIINAGEGDKTLIFVQSISSNTWNINHNMNKYPSVTIEDTSNTIVEGDVKYIDINNLRITFNSKFKGTAFIN